MATSTASKQVAISTASKQMAVLTASNQVAISTASRAKVHAIVVATGVLPYMLLSPPVAHNIAVLPPEFLAVAAQSQMTYAACIISFLGGLHWALAMIHQGGALLILANFSSPTHNLHPWYSLPSVLRKIGIMIMCHCMGCNDNELPDVNGSGALS